MARYFLKSFFRTWSFRTKELQPILFQAERPVKNMYYDSSYDNTEDVHSNMSPYCNDENSPKNMDLNSEKQQSSDLYLNTRKNERKNRTKNFYDVRGSSRDNLGTEPLRFESSTEDRTYEVPYAATRQSHNTVRNNYISNIRVNLRYN